MISANELRIGNYYDHNGEIRQVTPNTILEVWEAEHIWCEPIPITEEILFKCGFENIGSSYNTWGLKSNEFSGYLFTIELDKPFYFKVCDLLLNHWSERPIQYLHQLQNLYFSLTGEELTINL